MDLYYISIGCMNLFRKESEESQLQKFLGRPSIVQSLPLKTTAILSFFVLFMLFFFVVCGSYTRRITVIGNISPYGDVIRIYGPPQGVIETVNIKEGQSVSKGSILFIVRNDRIKNSISSTNGKIVALKNRINLIDVFIENGAKLANLTLIKINGKIQIETHEIKIFDSMISLLEKKSSLSEDTLNAMGKLFKTHNISRTQYQTAKREFIDIKIDKNEIVARRENAKKELLELELMLSETPIDWEKERLNLSRSREELYQQLLELDENWRIEVNAPIDGKIGTINASIGKSASRQEWLATLVPSDYKMEAILYVPSKAIGFLKGNEHVQLRLDPFPYQKFGYLTGVVSHVSTTAVWPEEISGKVQLNEPVYLVRVKLDKQTIKAYGRDESLRPQMRLNADILLDKRMIYEWLLEPLYTITGKI
jgi:membrane fusion protein